MPATLLRRRAHRSAARSAGHGLWRERARRPDRREHARAAARARAQRRASTVGDYGTLGANGVLGGPSATARRRGGWSPATIAATAFAATPFLGRDDTNGYDETQRAPASCSAQPTENLRARFHRHVGRISTTATTRSAIDNSRTTLSDKPGPGHAAHARARHAARLRRRRVVRRRQPHRASARHAACIPSTATGATTTAGARTRPTTTSSASTASAARSAQICASCRVPTSIDGADFAWLAGAVCAAHRRRRAATRRLARSSCSAMANSSVDERLSRDQSRRATASSNGALGAATVLVGGARVRAAQRGLSAIPTARRFRPTKPCSADR